MTRTRLSLAPLAAVALLSLTSCGSSPDVAIGGGATTGTTTSTTSTSGDSSLLTGYGEPVPTVAPGGVDRDDSGLAAPEALAGAAADTGSGKAGGAPGGLSQEALRAGFVDDNADVAAYQRYVDDYRGPGRDLSTDGRQVVTVTDAAGYPLLGAAVTVGDLTLPSHVDGRALFFDTGGGEAVSASYGDATASGTVETDGTTVLVIDTARVDPSDLTVDLDLVLDTTGSMGDEIDQLNESLQDIATQLDALPSHPTIRYALTVYRDQGDAYVFRAHDFTELEEFSAELATTTADGGGDTPEALEEAFHASVDGPSWGRDTASVELMLLVADASGHVERARGESAYVDDVRAARERGIEVVPLAASGTDDPAEFQLRQLAQQTLGTFFFLTYDPDGSPGDGTTHHVDGYATGSLDELVVGHVSARLDVYSAQVDPQAQAPTR